MSSECWGRTLGRDGRVGRLESTAWGWWPTRGAREADAPGAEARGSFSPSVGRSQVAVVLRLGGLSQAASGGGPLGSRAWSSRRRQVFEDAGNDGWLGDGGDDANVAPALGTTAQVDGPYRPRRPERAYMDILQDVRRTILRSVSPFEIDGDVLGRELEPGRPRHAMCVLAL